MCTSKPKAPPAPVIPQSYSPQMVDQDSLDARDKNRRRQVSRAGVASTLLTGSGLGAGLPPTSGAKMALGT